MSKFSHTPTEEQLAVVDATRARDGASLMIEAYAGCAKSSTLELAGAEIRVPTLALAFNKRTADEMKLRFSSQFAVKTMNGLGHGALIRGLGLGQITLDDRKLGKLMSQIAKDRRVELASDQWDLARRWASLAMLVGIVPTSRQMGGRFAGLAPDEPGAWGAIADGLWISDDDQALLRDLVREVVEQDIDLLRKGTISYDDQLYGSVCLGGNFAKYPVVFVDEAQDLSPINHEMIARSLAVGGRLIAVGDSRQAIYAFRGADANSMANLRRLREAWTDLPLATTFRCPKIVVARQVGHAPGFTAHFANADGIASKLGRRTEVGLEWNWSDIEAALPGPEASIAVLCRNNAPLMKLAFRLLRSGIGVTMLGRDIGKGLTTLSRKLFEDEASPEMMLGAIEEWEATERSKALAQGAEAKVASVTDRAECLRAVIDSAGVRDARELRIALERLFARESGRVTLSSIHRAKGLEWDCVLHLDPWRIPSGAAKAAAKAGDATQMGQEHNLNYVAETRTRHTLLLASLEDYNG